MNDNKHGKDAIGADTVELTLTMPQSDEQAVTEPIAVVDMADDATADTVDGAPAVTSIDESGNETSGTSGVGSADSASVEDTQVIATAETSILPRHETEAIAERFDEPPTESLAELFDATFGDTDDVPTVSMQPTGRDAATRRMESVEQADGRIDEQTDEQTAEPNVADVVGASTTDDGDNDEVSPTPTPADPPEGRSRPSVSADSANGYAASRQVPLYSAASPATPLATQHPQMYVQVPPQPQPQQRMLEKTGPNVAGIVLGVILVLVGACGLLCGGVFPMDHLDSLASIQVVIAGACGFIGLLLVIVAIVWAVSKLIKSRHNKPRE